MEIAEVYDRQEAMEVIRRSMRDYDKLFVEPEAKPAKKSAPSARRKAPAAKAPASRGSAGRGTRGGK